MRTARRPPAALLLVLLAAPPAAGEEVNRVVLRVNDEIATLATYEARREARLQAIAAATELSVEDRRRAAEVAGRTTMAELFEELLIASRARQLHIEATPAQIDRAVEQTRLRFGIESDEALERELVRSGTTLAEFRARLARNLIASEVMRREVSPKVRVDPEEVARYWREHPGEFGLPERRRVQEAVVRDDSALAGAERTAVANRIRDGLIAGRTVAEAVAEAGGGDAVLVLDHDWIERGTLDASLEAAVWELAAGGVAGPLPARGGLHVLHLLEIRPPSERPLEEVREEIQARLEGEQFELRSRVFFEELSANAYLVERLPADAVGYRTADRGTIDPLRALLRGETPPTPAAAPQSAPPSDAAPAEPPPPPTA